MPEHKMITIDGIRVRSDEAARYRARTAPAPEGGQAPPLTAAQADPRAAAAADPDAFDPAEHTVLQVIAYLADADEGETRRVLDAEASGEKRKGLTERQEEFLQEARQRAATAGPGGGA
ncbi:hypothetical protein ACIQJX_35020 [Streptomyces griseoviridis]